MSRNTFPFLSWGSRIFCGVLLVTVLTYIGARMITPTITAPSRPPLPAQNGYGMLKSAASKVIEDKTKASYHKNLKDWTLTEKRAAVALNREAVQAAKESLRYPYQETNKVVSIEENDTSPSYGSYRALVRNFVVTGDVAWAEGRKREAIRYYLDGITIGRRIPHRVGVLPRQVGLACEIIGRRALWEHLEEMDADTTAIALNSLELLEKERLPLWESLEEEKYSALCIAMEAMGHPRQGEKAVRPGITSYAGLVPPIYVVGTMEAHFDQLIAQSRRPYIEGNEEIPVPREVFTAILAPVITGLRAKDTSVYAGDALLRVALALRIYKLRTGEYPADLNKLVAAKVLNHLPDDPFAKPGTPLRYKFHSDETYALYSVGPDCVDDNGKGIKDKAAGFHVSRVVNKDSKGDMIAGWYPY